MTTRRRPNAMLIELVIVILFFAISAGVILELFAAAHDRSVGSQTQSAATIMAEDLAERFASSGLAPEKFLLADGFAQGEDGYEKSAQTPAGRTVSLKATADVTQTDAGALSTLEIAIYDGEREMIRLPAARYIPKEETP